MQTTSKLMNLATNISTNLDLMGCHCHVSQELIKIRFSYITILLALLNENVDGAWNSSTQKCGIRCILFFDKMRRDHLHSYVFQIKNGNILEKI